MKIPSKLVAIMLTAGFFSAVSPSAAETKMGSVGLEVVPTATGELAVLQVVKGTPAAESGIKPGDLLIRVGDFPLAGSDFAEVVPRYLWGPVGSSVSIVYLRPGESGRKTVTLRRSALEPKLKVSPAVRNGAETQGDKR